MKRYKQDEIEKLAEILKNDGVISVPTDTVYGLCSRINSINAYKNLIKSKNRLTNKAFPVMCANKEQIENLAIIDEKAEKLINAFMPGPITLILNKKNGIPEYINNGKDTIAIRMATSKVLEDLIIKTESPIFMSSANQSGESTCTNLDDIEKNCPTINGIMEGNVSLGMASTIVDCTSDNINIIREGPISIEEINDVFDNNLLENIEVLCHSSIKLIKNKTIYFDPFKINNNYNDADFIFITHDHYDHYSEEDIKKVIKPDTIIVAPESILNKLLKYNHNIENIITVKPNEKYIIDSKINIETIPAYNINKQFHPKENNWVGYIIEIEGIRYYIAGDTDSTTENNLVKCDVAFLPVGGTYTMDFNEASKLANKIKPKIVIPIHYGDIVGTKQDAINFIKLLNKDIKGKVLIN